MSKIPADGSPSECEQFSKNDKITADQSIDFSQSFSNLSFMTHIDLMPSITLEAPLSLSLIAIRDCFRSTSQQHNFVVFEEQHSSMVVTFKPRLTIGRLLRCCLPREDYEFPTSASLHVTINERVCARIVQLRGVSGNPFPISSLFEDFSSKLNILSQEAPVQMEEEEEDFIITCKNEANSYYEFCKILSADSYSLGKSVSEFVHSFNQRFSAPCQLNPVDVLKEKIEETVHALFSDYNYGRGSAEKIMKYCRPAVEKYLYSKVNAVLIQVYKDKFADLDAKFNWHKEQMRNRDPFVVFGIRYEFRGNYKQSIEHLNRIAAAPSPSEKLSSLLSAVSEAQSDVLEGSHGSLELTDPRSVLSCILLRSNLQYPVAELMMLKDWYPPGLVSVFEDAIFSIIDFL